MNVVIRMDTSYNMDLSDSLIVKSFDDLKHFIMTVFPAVRVAFRFVIGAKPAVINALICWLNMKIAVKICKVAIKLPSDNPGEEPKQSEIGFFEQN